MSVCASSPSNLDQTSVKFNKQQQVPAYNITPEITLNNVKKILGQEKTIINLHGLDSFNDETLSYIAKYVLTTKDFLTSHRNASVYIDGNNLIFLPGYDTEQKVRELIASNSATKQEPIVAKSLSTSSLSRTASTPPPERLDYFSVTTSLGDLCNSSSFDAAQRKQSIASSTFGNPSTYDDIFTVTSSDGTFTPLTTAEKDRAGCSTAIAEVKVYISDSNDLIKPLTRNVEIKYKGMLRSINNNGYLYDNGNNGDEATLTGFVDEIRFITAFKNSNGWVLNKDLSSPLGDTFSTCSTAASLDKSKTSGWSIGATASGDTKGATDGVPKLGVSVSGGYSASSTVSNSTSISCNSDQFKVENNVQNATSNYYDTLLDANNAQSFYSSLQLTRIGKEQVPTSQSTQTYNTGNRDITSLTDNIVQFQRSLDEQDRSSRAVNDTHHDLGTPRWQYTVNSAHNPFGSVVSELLPEEIRNGFEHEATMTYVQKFNQDSNRYEVIKPRIETWYNPGYLADYVTYWGYTFGLEMILNRDVTKKVAFILPPISIDWLDQRLMSVKTLALESVKGGSTSYIAHNTDGSFTLNKVAYNATDYAQAFPITNKNHIFYMTNLIATGSQDKFQGFEINTYTTDADGILIKNCLGVNADNEPEMLACDATGTHSKTIWHYLTTSYIAVSEPNFQRSDFTICLRDEVVGEGKQCLTNFYNKLVIRDYNDLSLGDSLFEWNMVDLATQGINYRNYYNQDPL